MVQHHVKMVIGFCVLSEPLFSLKQLHACQFLSVLSFNVSCLNKVHVISNTQVLVFKGTY